MKAYVYGLYDPSESFPRYIGLSTCPSYRLNQHRADRAHPSKFYWLQKTPGVQLKLLDETHEGNTKLERFWIRHFQPMYNILGVHAPLCIVCSTPISPKRRLKSLTAFCSDECYDYVAGLDTTQKAEPLVDLLVLLQELEG